MTSLSVGRRGPGVAFTLVVAVASDLVTAVEESPMERSGTGGSSAVRGNLSRITAPPSIAVRHDIGRFLPQRQMRSLAAVEDKILGQADLQFAHCGKVLQIYVIILDASPEPLDEDVVERSSSSVHADDDALSLQDAGEVRSGSVS